MDILNYLQITSIRGNYTLSDHSTQDSGNSYIVLPDENVEIVRGYLNLQLPGRSGYIDATFSSGDVRAISTLILGYASRVIGGDVYTALMQRDNNAYDNQEEDNFVQNIEVNDISSQSVVDSQEYKDICEKLEEVGDSNVKLLEEKGELQDKITGLESDIYENNNKIEELESDIRSKDNSILLLETKLEDMKEIVEIHDNLRKEIEDKDSEISELKCDIENFKSRISELEIENDSLKDTSDTDEKIRIIQSVLQAKAEELNAIKEEKNALESKLISVRESNIKLQEAIDSIPNEAVSQEETEIVSQEDIRCLLRDIKDLSPDICKVLVLNIIANEVKEARHKSAKDLTTLCKILYSEIYREGREDIYGK